MKNGLICMFGAFVILFGPGCSGDGGDTRDGAASHNQNSSQPTVYVVNYPLQYFADRIAGGIVTVHFPAPREVDPAFWWPGAGTVGRYQQADLVLLNGAGYAKWVTQESLSASRLVNTSEGSRDRYINMEDAVTHSHGGGGEHSHSGTAFTTWLDMTLAVEQARAIAVAFEQRWPDNRQRFETNFGELENDLLVLDDDLRAIVAMSPQQPFIASHPVYQYFARCYGLNLESVHWEPDRPPSDAQWDELERLLEHHPAEWMIWEGEPGPDIVKRLESIGVQSIVFDPCANAPVSGDFLQVMRVNVENLKSAFAK